MTEWFSNFWVGVDVSESSRKSLENLTHDIKIYTEELWIDFKEPWRHHMTLGYFTHITSQDLIRLLMWLDDLKKERSNILLVNPKEKYDQTLHKITWRNSNVTNRFHLVLTPHNPDNIYKRFIQNHDITPHISLWSIANDSDHEQELLSRIKISRNIYIKNYPIVVNLNKILMEFSC